MTGRFASTPPGAERVGVAAALAAYILWGLAPIYFKLIQSVDALEIIAHRILWSIPFLAGFLLLRDRGAFLQRMRLPRRTVLTLLLSGALARTGVANIIGERVLGVAGASKTGLLEARPVYVCLESRTRGHLLVVMLAYLVVQELARCWHDLDLTVEEGLDELKSLCTTQVVVQGRSVLHNIPQPRTSVQRLLEAAHVALPTSIVDRGVRVSTRKKLTEERKTA